MRSRTKTPPINARGALLLASDQGQEGGDGDSVHLLWHSHGECSAAGGESDGATTGLSNLATTFMTLTNISKSSEMRTSMTTTRTLRNTVFSISLKMKLQLLYQTVITDNKYGIK